MSFSLITVVIIIAVLFILRVPIWASLIFASIPYFIINEVPLSAVPVYMCTGVMTSFILIAFPLFTLAGRLMNSAGITKRIFNFANANVGWIPGGLGHVNVLASMLFAGMSGSAVADLGALGTIEIKGMTAKGYDLDFSSAITLASSAIGPIIPPSTAVILYSVIANASVAKLFLGGIIPGIIMGISLMVMVFIYCRNRNYATTQLPTLKIWIDSFKAVFLALMNPVIILLGIVGGIFTPTEAAAVVVVYAIFLGTIVYKELTWSLFLEELRETVKLISNVYVILGGALLFGFILARENVGTHLIYFFTITKLQPTMVLFLIVCLVLILGCFIEVTALMILLLPVVLPVIDFIEVDKIYFGVVFIMAAIIGIMTPPFGLGLFIISGITEMSFNRTAKAVLPFLIPLLVTLGLVIIFPAIIMSIPNLLMK